MAVMLLSSPPCRMGRGRSLELQEGLGAACDSQACNVRLGDRPVLRPVQLPPLLSRAPAG